MKLLAAAMALAAFGVGAYPPAPRGGTTGVYFGSKVADPYRWLERVDSPQTKRWVAAETALTDRAFDRLSGRAAMRARVTRLMGSPQQGLPQRGGGTLAFTRSDGSLRRPVIVVARGGGERDLLDPNAMWPDGRIGLEDWALAPDGRRLAYATASGGAALVRWRVRDVSTGSDAEDEVLGSPDWAGITWAHDGGGFYYGGYLAGRAPRSGAPIGTGYAVRFHRLGTAQRSDRIVYSVPAHPDWVPYVTESAGGRFLIFAALREGEGNLIAVRDLRAKHPRTLALRALGAATYAYVDADLSTLYFHTNHRAAHWKLIAIDVRHPERERDVIPERADTLEDVVPVRGQFVARYLHDVRARLVAFSRRGVRIGSVPLPGPGSVDTYISQSGDSAENVRSPVTYFRFSSPTTPPTNFAYDARTGRLNAVARDLAPFDLRPYVTEELFARSADGTRIPVFVAHRRARRRDAPLMLTGYGAFGDTYHPAWSTLGAAWLARGGTFAIACVRGGGEYGEAWHRAGMLGKKQNAFDDFAAAARFLIAHGFASHATLGAYGYSGGGLLVGATEVQHPRLFGAVIEGAGPVDVLRGETYGSESVWTGEVGSPTASQEQFRWLYAYAPLVHIRRGASYPPTLVTTSENDQRVSPVHAYKFAATLQWAQAGTAPILLYRARGTGHIGGGSLAAEAAPLADAETFLWSSLTNS